MTKINIVTSNSVRKTPPFCIDCIDPIGCSMIACGQPNSKVIETQEEKDSFMKKLQKSTGNIRWREDF